MEPRELVQQHYGGAGRSARILRALADAGVDLTRLTARDLFPLDQLHAGGTAATEHLLATLALTPGAHILDVGCGIGGPARLATSTYDVRVTGVDLTASFIDDATDLTELVGLTDRAGFVCAPGEATPFDDAAFDAAMMMHVGMNLPDKRSVFAEVRRVLKPGGVFVLYDQMRVEDGGLPYPLPWAVDDRSSFVGTPEEYAADLASAGFTLVEVEDRTPHTAGPPPEGAVTPNAVFGPEFAERIGNNVAATRAGLLAAVLMIARS
jgi:SAM-dependent methyltransferase